MSEENRRRRDIGSGLSFELLDEDILKFIFNSTVREKILKNFSGLQDPVGGNLKNRQIYWNTEYGVASKDSSLELIFLGASFSDQIKIRNILQDDGGFSSVASLSSDSTSLNQEIGQLTFETLINILNIVISKIGPLIKICTAMRYSSLEYDVFKNDHIDTDENGNTKKRFIAFYTKDTRQGKILVDSYYTSMGPSIINGSHPAVITKKVANSFAEEVDGPFSLAKRYLNAHYNG